MPRHATLPIAPHNLEAERTVIGALLTDPQAIFKVDARLAKQDFYDPVFGHIYQAIQCLSQKGTPVDFVTVTNTLKDSGKVQQIGGSAFLAELASNVPTSSHVENYADIVLEYSRRRQLATLATHLATLAYEDGKSASELIEHAEQEFLQLSHSSNTQKPVTLADMSADRFERYTMLYEADDPTEHYGTRTGFRGLDDLMTAMAPGQVIVLAGRPSMGKTALALDIARHVGLTQKKTVAIFSLEMTKEEIFDRIFGHLTGIEPWKLAKGMLTEKQFMNMGHAFDQLKGQPIFVDDDPDRTLINLRSKARRLQIEQGIDLLIVDYLQLIQVTDRSARENQTQKMTHISESIKQLARELHCPILALSQLNRDCERRPDKRPQLADLRDSGSIEQDADRVLMLYRESYYNEDCADPDLTDVYVRKNRHGPVGHVPLTFDKEKMSFVDRS